MINTIKELKVEIALLAVLFLIFGFYFTQFHAFAADEYTYMNNARAISTGDESLANDPGRFPGFTYLLSVAQNVLGDNETTGRILNVFITFLTALAVLFMVYWSEKNKQFALITSG